MIYIILIIVGFILLYQIIKFKSTNYKYKEVCVLKNEMTSEWVGGTDKPFNLIGDILELQGDKIYIEREDKFVFNKLVKTSFSIKQDYMDDSDDNFM